MIENIIAVIFGSLIGTYITYTTNIKAPEERVDVKESPVEQVVVVSNDKGSKVEDVKDPVEKLIFHDSNYNWNNK